jgi:transposase
MQELERAKVIEAYSKGEIKAAVAALRLQISTRQAQRLKERFSQGGLGAIVSTQRGKPSNNQLNPELVQKALQIVREHYSDFGPTLASEMLHERHKLTLSKETLRRLMTEAGLWLPRSARQAGLHQPRERRTCFGELVQIDGSRHAWFEQRRAPCVLLVYIDDATSRILHLHFTETESTDSYFVATHSYLQQHGKPQAFYADRAAIFRSPAANRHTPTQFQRALDELGIGLICANSPQAKGRVERANRTLQDRLVKALRTEKIDTIDAANAWCEQFLIMHNERFACAAYSQLDAHVSLHKNDDLTRILTLRETRKLSAKLTLQHATQKYLLADAPSLRALIGQPIAIYSYRDGRVELRAGSAILPYSVLKTATPAQPVEVDSKTLHHVADQLIEKRQRARPHRQNQPSAVVATGVLAAKKMSAQKRV